MAEDELLSLCWNNFNTKLSAGFHESLCRGDLVDVTLAAEGELVKAHKIVLSVCSAYFRKMFTQMPANQHAFIFLKDVSSTALKDLIQFMYCGEVNVKQELLPAFISTAEALQIKGLTDGCPPSSQSPAAPSTSSRHRTQTQRATYKIDSLDKNVGKISQPTQATMKQHPQTTNQYHVAAPIASMGSTKSSTAVVTHKRQAQRSSVVGEESHIKRSKNTIDPLEMIEMRTSKSSGSNVETQQITEQTAILPAPELKSDHTIETECIDLPIEVTPKVEPDYFEESGDVDGTDNDGMGYVEDDSYGDVRYNVNYFTDNEDESTMATVPGTSGAASGGRTTATTLNSITKKQQSFSDSSCMETDQGNSEAQEMETDWEDIDEVEDTASENANNELIPQKSKAIYEKRFKKFCDWMALENKNEVNETLLLAYFNTELKSAAPSTKWSIFSMLKAMLKTKMNIDIGGYTRLVSFLKRKSKGFKPMTTKTLEKLDVFKFLREASDTDYLDAKVVLIMGISGACKREELLKLEINDVKDLGSCLSVDIRFTKTSNSRQFLISPGEDGLDLVKLVKTYMELRPPDTNHNRFFVQYIKGRCTRHPMGVNKLGLFPRTIAKYLGLPNAESYTSRCFRHTSATMLADAGADVTAL